LNTLVWARVALRPEERTVWGEEALALALAQAAAAAAGYGTDDEYQYLDTMAWALLANGQDAEAKAKSAEALGKAPDNEQEAYRGYQGDLETAITQAAEIMAAAEKRLAELTTAVGRRRTFRFELESQRFLHDALAELLGKLDLLERTQKAGVEQRLSWAKQVQALSLHHPNARHTWAAVRAAIASNPKYAGSPIELRDQDITGLVPIGENPVTRLWEFYELRSAWDGKQDPRTIAIPAHAADGSIEVTEELGIVFVLLPGGRFLMGAQKDDANLPNYDRAANPNEQPHEVTLAPYFLARHELTQGQWARLWAGGEGRWPSWYKVGAGYTGIGRVTAAQPVENVSWAMCSQVMEQNGLVLPTEAQWEYACRAGTTTPWYTGSTPETIEGHGNILDQTGQNVPPVWAGGEAFDDGFKGPAPVGHYEANAFGMFDMYGNVCEWCRDWDGVYGSERAGDGLRSGGDSSSRCYRGGGSIHAAANARSANRSHHGHSIRLNMIGVRPAR
jgi:formylglycine-generating enzyme required for sulfatase activity